MNLELVTVENSPNAGILKSPGALLTFPLVPEYLSLIEDIKAKVLELPASGLAANQVGHHLQIIVYQVSAEVRKLREDAEAVHPITVLINPRYTPIPEEGKRSDWEACFSITEWMGKVSRYKCIHYQGYDIDGKKVEGYARGYLARVLQHEIDHVHGILITDVLTPNCLQGPPAEMRLIRAKEIEHLAKLQAKL